MSIKPAIINAAQVSEQTLKLTKALKELKLQMDLQERRLIATERSLAENKVMRAQVARLRAEVFGQFSAEWSRRKELYPDIRLEILTKTGELLTPPKKDKGASSPGGSAPGDSKPK
jgi:hypothetical protein